MLDEPYTQSKGEFQGSFVNRTWPCPKITFDSEVQQDLGGHALIASCIQSDVNGCAHACSGTGCS